jgi:hypothetical protein
VPGPGVPPRKSRRGPLAILLIAGFLVVVVLGVVLIVVNNTRSQGRFKHAPAGCWLLSQAQVQAYVPGAASESGLEGAACTWEKPNATDVTGRVHVYVETFDRSTVKDAEDQYDIRRRQADEPGTTIIPLSNGDESFMACSASKGTAGSCESYTRLSNQVFKVEFESFDVRNVRDPASVVRTLTAQATQRLRQDGR